jgi:hypothetical protein
MISVLVSFSLLKPYVGPFFKPHEGFWRAIAEVAIIYVGFITFLVFQVITLPISFFLKNKLLIPKIKNINL